MKNILIAAALAVTLSLTAGCATVAKDFTASTTASYKAGDTMLDYSSTKNQENFKANITLDPETGKVTGLNVETTATTPESAIAATAIARQKELEFLQKLLDRIPAGPVR